MKQETRGEYLAKNTALFMLGSLGTRFISFFLVPLYTGVLTTSEYGVIDLVATICAILVPIISMNIGEAIMRFSLDKDANQAEIMKVGWIFMGICCFCGVVAYPIFLSINVVKIYAIYITMYSISMGLSQIAVCNLRGKELLLEYSIANIINSFVAASLNMVFLLVFKLGVQGYFGAYILSNLLTTLYALFKSRAFETVKAKTDYVLAKKMLQYSFFLIPTSLMWWITNSSDRIMVTFFVGVGANGIYAIAYKIPTLISSLTSIFNQAWSYSAIREQESCDETEYANRMYNNMFSMMVIVIAGLTFIMKPFLSIYVSEDYFVAWKYTPFLTIASLFLTMATFLSTSYTVHKDSKGFLVSGAVGALINIILNWILIPVIGVYGAAIATLVSYVCVFIFRSIHTQKYLAIKVFNKQHVLGTAILVLMSCTMYIDLRISIIILFFELVLVLCLYWEFIKQLLCVVYSVVGKYIRK